MDLAKLTGPEVDALDGIEREAWYAWRNGDEARAKAILATTDPHTETATADPIVETAVASKPRRSKG